MSAKTPPLGSRLSESVRATPYSRLPSRLEQMFPAVSVAQQEDDFGIVDRLAAIRHVLGARQLGSMFDLGGHTGYFSMSLIDCGMASRAIVYDGNNAALDTGRAIAAHLEISERIEFKEQLIGLEFLSTLPPVDTILCLNLVHHAGATFDIEPVKRDGWQRYAENWLRELHAKCRVAVISFGFKRSKPKFWDAPLAERPLRVAQMARKAGWSVLYDANVEDIHRLGVERANARYTTGPFAARVRSRLRSARNMVTKATGRRRDKKQLYHLFILERN